ncbi:methyltransferase domain-containing protein [Candidatus Thioglobus sp.]|nr:methyltransferase domain-containing protein [Candidatus Thioglobus sp.]
MSKSCQSCESSEIKLLLDLGLQPVQNRFASEPHSHDYYHPLNLGQCQNCSLIQLIDPVPVIEMIPKVDWLKYNEPEDHLEDLAGIICDLKDLPENPVALGITYKDDSLLNQLKEKAFRRTSRINPLQDLGITQKGVAGETIIPKITSKAVNNLTDKYGYFDVVIARHVLEHAIDAKDFLSLIWDVLNPGGYIVFEVPDCNKEMDNNDYTMPWEEHILYFVPETLKEFFTYTSYDFVQLKLYPFQTEDIQIVIVQKIESSKKKNLDYDSADTFPEVCKKFEDYAHGFFQYKKIINAYLKEYFLSVGKIAFFGAGHRAIMYIKGMEIEGFIDFIIDDMELKKNLYLAGTSLQIKSSESLEKENISLCLLCVSIQHEDKIIKKFHKFVNKGGIFASIHNMQEKSLFKRAIGKIQL